MATANNVTVARPYARAVFDLAIESGQVAAWAMQLKLLSDVCKDVQISPLLKNPFIAAEQIAKLFVDVLQTHLSEQAKTLVHLLAKNKRIAVLPEMFALFNQLRAEHEKTLDVEVQAYLPISDKQQAAIKAALEKRLSRKVSLQTQINKKLLGGAVIYAGDLVIDGSIRGKLDKLTSEITA